MDRDATAYLQPEPAPAPTAGSPFDVPPAFGGIISARLQDLRVRSAPFTGVALGAFRLGRRTK